MSLTYFSVFAIRFGWVWNSHLKILSKPLDEIADTVHHSLWTHPLCHFTAAWKNSFCLRHHRHDDSKRNERDRERRKTSVWANHSKTMVPMFECACIDSHGNSGVAMVSKRIAPDDTSNFFFIILLRPWRKWLASFAYLAFIFCVGIHCDTTLHHRGWSRATFSSSPRLTPASRIDFECCLCGSARTRESMKYYLRLPCIIQWNWKCVCRRRPSLFSLMHQTKPPARHTSTAHIYMLLYVPRAIKWQ